ncbi:MAG: DNA-binding transcriptional regulator [Planctomycetia bacterium]|nr:DNA-binding transcriptional regulator [Planctomycetia bacterium]
MKTRKIALIFEMYNMLGCGMLHGITKYISEHRHWDTQHIELTFESTLPPWLSRWKGDGIIVRDKFGTCCPHALKTGAKVVDLSIVRTPEAGTIFFDTDLLIQMAIDYFHERFYRNLAYVGIRNLPFTQERAEIFLRKTNGEGHLFEMDFDENNDYSRVNDAKLTEWLRSLPKPVGILGCYDSIASKVVETCRKKNLDVPESIAVLGVNNDNTYCYLADPPLSSIVPNAFEIGYRTCELLEAMMNGEEYPAERLSVQPMGVITRRSTDTLALDDPLLVRAIQTIRKSRDLDLTVSDVARMTGMSKRTLERRFRQTLHYSPLDEINRVRFQRSCVLLKNTRLTIDAITKRVGFRSKSYFFAEFQNRFGMTPGEFRRRMVTATHFDREEIQEFFLVR